MKAAKQKRQAKTEEEKMVFTYFVRVAATVMLFLLFASAFYLVMCYTPMTKEDHINQYNKMTEEVEPFRKNLTECARQVRASMVDVENFLKKIPQSTTQGKCFVACILKRNAIIKNNKIEQDNLLEVNKQFYEDDSEVIARLKVAIGECMKIVEDIYEICEYASVFNDCMHIKMEHILESAMMERRLEAVGQMTTNPEEWTAEDDDMLKLVKDEL